MSEKKLFKINATVGQVVSSLGPVIDLNYLIWKRLW